MTNAASNAIKVRRGDVRRAVIVRIRKSVRRLDGRMIRFDDNAAVLLNNKREMLGTRIGGVVSADLRMNGWGKIVSLAPKVSPFSLSNSPREIIHSKGFIDVLSSLFPDVPYACYNAHHTILICSASRRG